MGVANLLLDDAADTFATRSPKIILSAMAVGSISIILQASRGGRDCRPIPSSAFVSAMMIGKDDCVSEVYASDNLWSSSYVQFAIIRLRDFEQQDAPFEAMTARMHEVLLAIASFLDRRPVELFTGFRDAGLSVRLLIDLWMNQDQMELDLPPELMAACARHHLSLRILSNNISAEEAIAFGST